MDLYVLFYRRNFSFLGGFGHSCLLGRFGFHEVENEVECDYVDDEEEEHYRGVKDGIAVYQLIEHFVWSSVTANEEHIVIIEEVVGDHSGNCKETEDAKGDADVFLLHTSHTCDGDIKTGE